MSVVCMFLFVLQKQYIYVYQALLELNEVDIIACSELKQTFDELCKSSKLAEQFEV